MPDPLTTALDLYRDSSASVFTVWGLYTPVVLGLLGYILGKEPPVPGRAKIGLGIGFFIFSIANSVSLWQRQSVAYAAYQAIGAMRTTPGADIEPALQAVLDQIWVSPPTRVVAYQIFVSMATVAAIWMAHRHDSRKITRTDDPVKASGRQMHDSQRGDGFCVDQIDHVELFVPDRYEAATWYERVLGLKIVGEYEHWAADPRGPLMISSDSGNTKLALFQGTPQGSRETAGYHLVAFRVGATDFKRFLDRLPHLNLIDHRGQAVVRDLVRDHTAAYSLYFNDPFGHRLELTTYQYEQTKQLLGR